MQRNNDIRDSRPAEIGSRDAERGERCRGDPILVRHRRVLEALRVGQWHLGHPHPLDRCVELVEAGLLDARGQLCGDSVAGPALLHAERAVGARHRLHDRLDVQRAQRAQVDHLDGHAVRLAESLRHLERAYHRERVRHDRQVAARPRDTRLADRREEVGVERHLALLLVDRKVLDHEHGVVVADGGLQQTLGVGRRGRGHDLQAGRAGEPAVERLRVLGGELIARPVRRADHQRAAHLAAEHRAHLGGVVDHLVHRNQQEVDRHDLHDRALAEHRRAHARAHEPLLGDRRVADAIRAEGLQQSGGDLVGAVEQPNLLAHHEHAVVAGELLGQREPQRLAVGHDLRGGALGDGAHAPSPASKVSFSSPNGLPGRMRSNCAALPAACIPKASSSTAGSGLASAYCTAAWT